MQWFESEGVITVDMSDQLNFAIWMKGPLHVSSDIRHVPTCCFCLSHHLYFMETRSASLQSTPESVKNVPASHFTYSSFFIHFPGDHPFTSIIASENYGWLIITSGATLSIYKHFMKQLNLVIFIVEIFHNIMEDSLMIKIDQFFETKNIDAWNFVNLLKDWYTYRFEIVKHEMQVKYSQWIPLKFQVMYMCAFEMLEI